MRGGVTALLLLLVPLAGRAQTWPDLGSPSVADDRAGALDSALIIGIERYAALPEVAGATANALDWQRWLAARGVRADRIQLLRDRQATVTAILRHADRLAVETPAGGTLWLVFVGHGAPARDQKGGVLVTWAAQNTEDEFFAKSVSQGELLGRLVKGRQARTVAVIDACFSGLGTGGRSLVPGLQPALRALRTVLPASVTVLSAGTAAEFAGPLPGTRRPAFSYLVLGALRGWGDDRSRGFGDGRNGVSAKEAIAYAKAAIQATVVGRTQTPSLRGVDLTLAAGAERGPDLTAIARGGGGKPTAVMPRRGVVTPGARVGTIDLGDLEQLKQIQALANAVDAARALAADGSAAPESKAKAWEAVAAVTVKGGNPHAKEATAAALQWRAVAKARPRMRKDAAALSELAGLSVVPKAQRLAKLDEFLKAYRALAAEPEYATVRALRTRVQREVAKPVAKPVPKTVAKPVPKAVPQPVAKPVVAPQTSAPRVARKRTKAPWRMPGELHGRALPALAPCYRLAKRSPSDAGDCLMRYQTKHRDTKTADVALTDAAVMYRDAGLVAKALTASERLFNQRQSSPLFPQALVTIATAYSSVGVFSEAAYYYEFFVKKHGKTNPAWSAIVLDRAVRYRLALGQPSKARAALSGAKFLSAKARATPTLALARYLTTHDDAKGAVKLLKSAKTREGLTALGAAYQTLGNRRRAMAALTKAIAAPVATPAGDTAEAIVRLVRERAAPLAAKPPGSRSQKVLLSHLRLAETLVGELQSAAEKRDARWRVASLDELGRLLETIGQIADAMNERTRRRRIAELAIETYTKCLGAARAAGIDDVHSQHAAASLVRLDPKARTLSMSYPADVHYLENASVPRSDQAVGPVLALMRRGQLKDALKEARRVAQAHPEVADAHGLVSLLMKRVGEAGGEAFSSRAIQLEKFNAIANSVVAARAIKRKDWSKAIAASRSALIGHRDSMNSYQNLIRAYHLANQHPMAVLIAERALDLEPDNAAISNTLGLVHMARGKPSLAFEAFRRAAKGAPWVPQYAHNAGVAGIRTRRFAEVVTLLTAVHAHRRTTNPHILMLGVAMAGEGEGPIARMAFESLASDPRRGGDAAYNLCRLHELKEDTAAAKAACTGFVQSHAGHAKVPAARQYLRQLPAR